MNNKLNSWVEIKAQNLKYNIQQFRKIISPQTKLMVVVKSNAYGHDLIKVSKTIEKYVDWLGVVNLAEALILRKNNIRKPILVLSYYFKNLKEAIQKNISLVVYNPEQLQKINQIATQLKKIAKVHLKLETGTARLGAGEAEVLKLIQKIKGLKNIKLEGIFSHFAASEENQKFTQLQLDKFNRFIKKLEKQNINIPLKHFACSAATLVKPESHFNLIRVGISSYGLWPSKQTKKITRNKYPWFKLKPVLTWKTQVIQVKYLGKGAPVGYGCTYKTKKKTKIAVLPVGYWEGYDRHLSNKGEVLIKGKKSKILGRVCMNLIMVEVTGIKNVKVGDEVVLIGQQGKEEITADELAEKIGTINYEIVTRINPLLLRILK